MSIPRRNISPRNSSLLLQTGHRKKYRPALQACCYGNNTGTSQLFTLFSLDHISSVSPVPRPPPSFHLWCEPCSQAPTQASPPPRPIPSFQFTDRKLQRPWKEMEEASLSSKVVSLYICLITIFTWRQSRCKKVKQVGQYSSCKLGSHLIRLRQMQQVCVSMWTGRLDKSKHRCWGQCKGQNAIKRS